MRCHKFHFSRNVIIAGGKIEITGPTDRFLSFHDNIIVSRGAPAISNAGVA